MPSLFAIDEVGEKIDQVDATVFGVRYGSGMSLQCRIVAHMCPLYVAVKLSICKCSCLTKSMEVCQTKRLKVATVGSMATSTLINLE
jgi:hypothetical protein